MANEGNEYITADADTDTQPVYQRRSNGNLHVHKATLDAGEDQTNDVLVVEQGQFAYKFITAAATADLSQNAGAYLHAVVVGNAALTGTVTLYDESTGGTTLIAGFLPAGALGNTYVYNCALTQGLQVVTSSAADDITVIYRASASD